MGTEASILERVGAALEAARAKLPKGTRVRDVTTLEDECNARVTLDAITEFVPTEEWVRAAERNKLSPTLWTVVSAGGSGSQAGRVEQAAAKLVERHLEEWAFVCEHFPGTEPKP